MLLEKTIAEKERRPECIIASNRGPIEYYVEDDTYKMRLGSGGVVTALLGATQRRRITWVAFAMTETDRQALQANQYPSHELPSMMADMTLRLLNIPEQTYHRYYYAISNQVLWFAQHELLDPIMKTMFTQQTKEDWEKGYCAANEEMAQAIIEELKWGTDIPVILQDYQLYLVAGLIRERYPNVRLSHVIYIPWPDARYLAMLPDYMVQTIYSSMVKNDIIGFQTLNDARNFLTGAERFLPGVEVCWDTWNTKKPGALFWQGRYIQICLYPATLSAPYLHSMLHSQAVDNEMRALRSQLPAHGQLIVRVDRVEPTKNIIRGFQAYAHLLHTHPEVRGQVTLLALLVPSREELEIYGAYEHEVRSIIAHINAQYGQADWQPIVALYGNNRMRALAALQDYDVLLVNPVIDGMNLVVKEGGLLNQRSGVIILSRTVGVHDTLGEHVLSITPLDRDATADALFRALTMSREERALRADRIRNTLLKEDAKHWFALQLEDLSSQSSSRGDEQHPTHSIKMISQALANLPIPSEPGLRKAPFL